MAAARRQIINQRRRIRRPAARLPRVTARTAPKSAPSEPKRVVYLIGAGATQSEVAFRAVPINILMKDSDDFGEGISTAVLRRARAAALPPVSGGVDIEKLITLLSATSGRNNLQLAASMRRFYFEEIVVRLAKSKVIDHPLLATALLELHGRKPFRDAVERLTGILTTNHDGLFQLAFKAAYRRMDIGIPFRSAEFEIETSLNAPPLLQLHGSFTWRFGLPTTVSSLKPGAPYSADLTWIPPTVLKEAKTFPFNKLAGRAYELLSEHCDVLRVVGSSLTQNDWNVLSLIFAAQKHLELKGRRVFSIELIMSQERGVQLQEECSYLRHLTPIGFLREGAFADFKDSTAPLSKEQKNPFAYWLREKIRYHTSKRQIGDRPLGQSMIQVSGGIP